MLESFINEMEIAARCIRYVKEEMQNNIERLHEFERDGRYSSAQGISYRIAKQEYALGLRENPPLLRYDPTKQELRY